ncbi:hypothetical protein [Cryobacterium psychrophilum]|uniref:Fimbrial assembly protein n=1 Tax=Cryobacterium psychrophilum TaxID=41988 RepID=A0A4Y8KRF0_9MICO|nr:hypothetical protein [Cryobacterium psychrophilum]TDW29727.1 hypothetical protein EDD25_1437 [Cryobacterium psychrophilum]TFD81833.1 hypothetical protein E3T53_02255 [Cryobacterium psychrophilum]
MSKKHSAEVMSFGAEPRMDLLPPEIRLMKRDKATRWRLGALLVTVVLVVSAGIGASTLQATSTQAELAAERERTAELLAEQVQYAEVHKVQTALDMTRAARGFAASTEFDWAAYVADIQLLLPADVGIASVTLDGANPFMAYEQPTTPLLNPRLATITIRFTSPAVSSLPPWLEVMSSLPGYADSQARLTSRTAEGTYSVDWVLHVNEEALAQRFSTPEGE